jgi:hypothetical protein
MSRNIIKQAKMSKLIHKLYANKEITLDVAVKLLDKNYEKN